jgi:hypothetical protein
MHGGKDTSAVKVVNRFSGGEREQGTLNREQGRVFE